MPIQHSRFTTQTLPLTATMATPNEATDLKTRIQQAKDWLQENPSERVVVAARIFNLSRTTLSSSIKRENTTHNIGGLNRILTLGQERSLNEFIRSYLNHNLQPTKGVLKAYIARLRALEKKPPPSESWFQKWWKTQPLHKITTKPLAFDRINAQDICTVALWFEEYRAILRKHNIQPKDIWNFDETGFRIGCPKGEQIYVPLEVKQVN
jgi:hypothetical protein